MIRCLPLSVPLSAALALAQIQPGHAVVAWKMNSSGPGGLVLVDPTGVTSAMPGLAAATIGTGLYDGARSVLVTDDETVFTGLGVDNRTGSGPVNLDLRRITWNGATATDTVFATLLPVPAGQIWQVVDLKERADGSLLVAATEIMLGPNPIGTPAAFIVDPTGTMVTSILNVNLPPGILTAIADFGDMFAVAIDQSFVSRDVVLLSLPFGGGNSWTFGTLVGVGSFGGFDRDLNGDLVVGASFNGSGGTTVHRFSHAPFSVHTAVSGGPASIRCGDVDPAGILSSFSAIGSLSRSDTVLGGTQGWAGSVINDPIAISVRDNPAGYGVLRSPQRQPMLGSQGNVPAVGNVAFALRMAEPWAIPGFAIVAASFGRAAVPTIHGTLLIDQATMVTVGSTAIPAGQTATVALPIPANVILRGTRLVFQDVLLTNSPLAATLSNGLDLIVQ